MQSQVKSNKAAKATMQPQMMQDPLKSIKAGSNASASVPPSPKRHSLDWSHVGLPMRETQLKKTFS